MGENEVAGDEQDYCQRTVDDMRRVKVTKMAIEFFTQGCTAGNISGPTECIEGLPKGAICVGICCELDTMEVEPGFARELPRTITAIFQHPSFDQVPCGDPVPELTVMRRDLRGPGCLTTTLPVPPQGWDADPEQRQIDEEVKA